MLVTTWSGWSLLIVGSLVGGLFAAFSFAISVFAVPMMLAEKTDALSAIHRPVRRLGADRLR